MPFIHRLTVRFGDTDPAGLVYYPNLFHYLHVAMEEFFAEVCDKPYHSLMSELGIGFPTVKVETEFMHPLVYGDEVEVEIQPELGRSTSIVLTYLLRRASDGLLCVKSTQVHVAMQLTSRRATPVPQFIRDAFTKLS